MTAETAETIAFIAGAGAIFAVLVAPIAVAPLGLACIAAFVRCHAEG